MTSRAPARSRTTPTRPADVSREFASLRTVLHTVSGEPDPGHALEPALGCVMEGTGSSHGALWLLDAHEGVSREVHRGLTRSYLEAFGALGEEGPRAIGAMAGAEDVVLAGTLEDSALPGPLRDLLRLHLGVRSMAVIPLRARDRSFGAILLGHAAPAWFSRFSLDYLRALGDVLASALDRARLVAAARESEERRSAMVRSAADAIVAYDLEGRITDVNPAFERLLGYPREELIGSYRAIERELRERGVVVNDRKDLVHRSGERIPVVINSSLIRDGKGTAVGGMSVIRDEREVLAADERVRAARYLMEEMLEHLDAAVALVELPGLRVLAHNPAYARLLTPASAAAGVEGTLLSEHFAAYAGSVLGDLVRRAAEGGGAASAMDAEIAGIEPGPTFWSIKVVPLKGADGHTVERLLVTLTDTSERRRLEEELRHAQKVEVVGELAGGIAHDFNNLLTVILGNIPLALADLPPDHPAVPGLKDSETAAQRAAELTRQLLTFGRRAQLQPRPLDVNDVVREAVRLLGRTLGPGIEIMPRLDADLWPVQADPSHISQLLINLCLNARDAMPEGGRLTISTRNLARVREPAVRRGRTLRGGHVVLTVRDTGHGMTPDVTARIYEPFFTTKAPGRGTGLGLAVVYGIVEQHGGRIECESTPGEGTSFAVHLPRLARRMEDREPVAPPGTTGGTETVLFVDDEEVVRTVARSVLERKGYRVITAADGIEALEKLRRHGDQLALVLLDVAMPRMEGGAVLEELRRAKPDMPVIVVSGFVEPAQRRRFEELGISAFLDKPFRPPELAACVREVLDRARA